MQDPIKFCPVLTDEQVWANRVYYMRIDRQLKVRLEPESQAVLDAWNVEFQMLHFSLGKQWTRFPSMDSIGTYEDAVWVFTADRVEAWRKGKPEELIFSQNK